MRASARPTDAAIAQEVRGLSRAGGEFDESGTNQKTGESAHAGRGLDVSCGAPADELADQLAGDARGTELRVDDHSGNRADVSVGEPQAIAIADGAEVTVACREQRHRPGEDGDADDPLAPAPANRCHADGARRCGQCGPIVMSDQ